eukprot:scaffold7075_cov274-Pinguiococcus_pyrenoidosus.AAC.5
MVAVALAMVKHHVPNLAHLLSKRFHFLAMFARDLCLHIQLADEVHDHLLVAAMCHRKILHEGKNRVRYRGHWMHASAHIRVRPGTSITWSRIEWPNSRPFTIFISFLKIESKSDGGTAASMASVPGNDASSRQWAVGKRSGLIAAKAIPDFFEASAA